MTDLALRKLKFHLLFSIMVVMGALLVTWLILGDSSPFHDYFIRSDVPDIWVMTTAVPFIISAILSGNPHSPPMAVFMLLLVIQWFLFGLLLSIPVSKLYVRSLRK